MPKKYLQTDHSQTIGIVISIKILFQRRRQGVMCDYSQVIYHKCGHIRYLVLAWCTRYQRTHERCPPNIIDIDNKDEKCGKTAAASQ